MNIGKDNNMLLWVQIEDTNNEVKYFPYSGRADKIFN